MASMSILLYENIDSGKWWWTMIRGKWVVSPDYKDSYIEVLTENLLPLRTKADITQEELASMPWKTAADKCRGAHTFHWYCSLTLT